MELRFSPWSGNQDPTCCMFWPKKDLEGPCPFMMVAGSLEQQMEEGETQRELQLHLQ